MFGFNNKSHSFVVDEKNVTTVLAIINQNCRVAGEMRVGPCGWLDEPTKWFIIFSATKKQYTSIVTELAENANIDVTIRR